MLISLFALALATTSLPKSTSLDSGGKVELQKDNLTLFNCDTDLDSLNERDDLKEEFKNQIRRECAHILKSRNTISGNDPDETEGKMIYRIHVPLPLKRDKDSLLLDSWCAQSLIVVGDLEYHIDAPNGTVVCLNGRFDPDLSTID